MEDNNALNQLIYLFSKLPGLGNRSARRIVVHLLQNKELRLEGLIEGLSNAAKKINYCTICNNIDSGKICTICSNNNRTNNIIAVVETVVDLWAIERSSSFQGRYHILNNISNSTKKLEINLNLNNLVSRCKNNNTKELIIATNSTIDGQTTAYLIMEYFKSYPSIKITRLASGIPIGGELDYLDEGTVTAALESRKPFL